MDGIKLGKKLKQLRIEKELEQKDLADICRLKGYQQVSKWETGRLFPSVEQIAILSDELDANLFETLVQSYNDYREAVNSGARQKIVQSLPPVQDESKKILSRFDSSDDRSKVRGRRNAQDSTRAKGKGSKD